MQEHQTKKSTRIVIWVITIVMAGGFIGSYFLIILNNDSQNTQAASTAATTDSQSQTATTPDPTAYKTTAAVTSLQITDEKIGTGDEVKAGDSVRVNYKGTLAQTGVKFDSSYDTGQPATFSLAQVIPGWQQGIPGMKVGGKRRLVVPAALAYGDQASGSIPANSDLVFEVELLAVNPPDAQSGQ